MTQQNSSSAIAGILIPLGLMMILMATIVPFFMPTTGWALAAYKYVYTAGAVLMLLTRLFTPFRGTDLKLKRLHRLEAWSPLIFMAGAFFLFAPMGSGTLRDWIAFTLAGAALQIYTSIAIPLRQVKLANNDSAKS